MRELAPIYRYIAPLVPSWLQTCSQCKTRILYLRRLLVHVSSSAPLPFLPSIPSASVLGEGLHFQQSVDSLWSKLKLVRVELFRYYFCDTSFCMISANASPLVYILLGLFFAFQAIWTVKLLRLGTEQFNYTDTPSWCCLGCRHCRGHALK